MVEDLVGSRGVPGMGNGAGARFDRRGDCPDSDGHQARDRLPTMAAVDAKVSIGGDEDGPREGFGHPHQAGIGQAHGNVPVFAQEAQHPIQLPAEVESRNQGPPPQQGAQRVHASLAQEVEGFGEHRITGTPGQRQTG